MFLVLSWMDDGTYDLQFASWYCTRAWMMFFYGFLIREGKAPCYEARYLSYSDGALVGSSTTHNYDIRGSTCDVYSMIWMVL